MFLYRWLVLAFSVKESSMGAFNSEERLTQRSHRRHTEGLFSMREIVQVAFAIALVLRREKMWSSMIASDFGVFEGADVFEFYIVMFVEDILVAVLPDAIGEVSEGGNGAGDTVLSSIALNQAGFCGMDGCSNCP
jgi:hypothetical protein